MNYIPKSEQVDCPSQDTKYLLAVAECHMLHAKLHHLEDEIEIALDGLKGVKNIKEVVKSLTTALNAVNDL